MVIKVKKLRLSDINVNYILWIWFRIHSNIQTQYFRKLLSTAFCLKLHINDLADKNKPFGKFAGLVFGKTGENVK